MLGCFENVLPVYPSERGASLAADLNHAHQNTAKHLHAVLLHLRSEPLQDHHPQLAPHPGWVCDRYAVLDRSEKRARKFI